MSNKPRFTGAPNEDNTDRRIKNDFKAPAFAATIALAISGLIGRTLVKPAALTGAVTFTVNVTDPQSNDAEDGPFVGDTIEFFLVSDGTTRTATFGTGFLPTGTLAVTTAKYAYIAFKFNGTGYIETSRAVSA